MANYIQYGTCTFISAEDLSDKIGYAVKLNGTADGNGQAKVALASTNEKADGIVLDGGRESGNEVTVATDGAIVDVRCGGSVTVGQYLKVTSGGKLVTAGGTGDDNVIAKALKSGSDGELVKALIVKFVL